MNRQKVYIAWMSHEYRSRHESILGIYLNGIGAKERCKKELKSKGGIIFNETGPVFESYSDDVSYCFWVEEMPLLDAPKTTKQ
jgi:hypothetical protein